MEKQEEIEKLESELKKLKEDKTKEEAEAKEDVKKDKEEPKKESEEKPIMDMSDSGIPNSEDYNKLLDEAFGTL